MTKTLTRVYDSYTTAQVVVDKLKAAGLGDSHIGIVASNTEGWHQPGGSDVNPKHDKDRDGKDDRAEGAATGGGECRHGTSLPTGHISFLLGSVVPPILEARYGP